MNGTVTINGEDFPCSEMWKDTEDENNSDNPSCTRHQVRSCKSIFISSRYLYCSSCTFIMFFQPGFMAFMKCSLLNDANCSSCFLIYLKLELNLFQLCNRPNRLAYIQVIG